MGIFPSLGKGCDCEFRHILSPWTLCWEPRLLERLLDPGARPLALASAQFPGWIPMWTWAWILFSWAQIR